MKPLEGILKKNGLKNVEKYLTRIGTIKKNWGGGGGGGELGDMGKQNPQQHFLAF